MPEFIYLDDHNPHYLSFFFSLNETNDMALEKEFQSKG